MKKFIVIATAAALILWGLVKSPQSSEIASQTLNEIKSQSAKLTSLLKKEKTLVPTVAENMKDFDSRVAELNSLKSKFDERLVVYKKLDSEFTALVLKNRENPNVEFLKKKEAELEDEFAILKETLKDYQEKSQELYKFQNSTLNNI